MDIEPYEIPGLIEAVERELRRRRAPALREIEVGGWLLPFLALLALIIIYREVRRG